MWKLQTPAGYHHIVSYDPTVNNSTTKEPVTFPSKEDAEDFRDMRSRVRARNGLATVNTEAVKMGGAGTPHEILERALNRDETDDRRGRATHYARLCRLRSAMQAAMERM